MLEYICLECVSLSWISSCQLSDWKIWYRRKNGWLCRIPLWIIQAIIFVDYWQQLLANNEDERKKKLYRIWKNENCLASVISSRSMEEEKKIARKRKKIRNFVALFNERKNHHHASAENEKWIKIDNRMRESMSK